MKDWINHFLIAYGICPMYTIEGEVKLVDQGNEYVVHKNLGEPYAQE